MAPHPLSISGTPTSGKNRVLTSHAHGLWAVFKELRKAGDVQQSKLNEFVAKRHLILPGDVNNIDTVRMSLPVLVVPRDRPHLTKRGFVLGKSLHKAKKLSDGSLADPDPGYELWQRPFDDCRVMLWPKTEEKTGKCVIEVALSRVLGIPNHRLHELRQIDVQRGFEILMLETLPWTTAWADADVRGFWWALVRLDLARDVYGNAQHFAVAYENTRWPRVQSDPKVMKNGICWKAISKSQTPHQLRIYDKGEQMRDVAWPHAALDLADAPLPGAVMRVERQFVGMAGLPALGKLLDGADRGIRVGGRVIQIVSREADRDSKTLPIELSLTGLHRALAWEIGLLGHGDVVATSKRGTLARAFARDPVFRSDFLRNWGRDIIREIRKLAGKLGPAAMGLDLLQACYGVAAKSSAGLGTAKSLMLNSQ